MGFWKKAQHCFETAFGSEEERALRTSLALISSAEFAQVFQDTAQAKMRNGSA
jgi:hypothetical protein